MLFVFPTHTRPIRFRVERRYFILVSNNNVTHLDDFGQNFRTACRIRIPKEAAHTSNVGRSQQSNQQIGGKLSLQIISITIKLNECSSLCINFSRFEFFLQLFKTFQNCLELFKTFYNCLELFRTIRTIENRFLNDDLLFSENSSFQEKKRINSQRNAI